MTQVGIYPYDFAVKYNIALSREVRYADRWRKGVPDVKKLLLNIDSNPWHTLAKDANAFAQKVVQINATLKPELICIENEELLMTGSIDQYCNNLKAVVMAFDALFFNNITNGGLTLPALSLWYYKQSGDIEFYVHNIPANIKADYEAGKCDEMISKCTFEIEVLKVIPVRFVNVHYYFGQVNQPDGLIRMFKYLAGYTGKPVISNEAGTYTTGLLPEVVRVARECEMPYLILYSGDGKTGNAQPISKTDFQSAIL